MSCSFGAKNAPKNSLIRALLVVLLILSVGLTTQLSLAVEKVDISDRDIMQALRSKLQQDRFISDHQIDLLVENGVAMLSGTVDHLLAKERATEIASQMKGVLDVKNELTVREKPLFRLGTVFVKVERRDFSRKKGTGSNTR